MLWKKIGGLVLIFVDPILATFRLEQHVFELAGFAVCLSALAYPIVAVEFVFNGMAQGMKHPRYSFVANTLRMLGVSDYTRCFLATDAAAVDLKSKIKGIGVQLDEILRYPLADQRLQRLCPDQWRVGEQGRPAG